LQSFNSFVLEGFVPPSNGLSQRPNSQSASDVSDERTSFDSSDGRNGTPQQPMYFSVGSAPENNNNLPRSACASPRNPKKRPSLQKQMMQQHQAQLQYQLQQQQQQFQLPQPPAAQQPHSNNNNNNAQQPHRIPKIPSDHIIHSIPPIYIPPPLPPSKRSRSNSFDKQFTPPTSRDRERYTPTSKDSGYTNSTTSVRGTPLNSPMAFGAKPRLEQLEAFFELFSSGDLNQIYYSLTQLCDSAVNVQMKDFIPFAQQQNATLASNFHGLFIFWMILHVLHPDGIIKVLDRRIASSMLSSYHSSPSATNTPIANSRSAESGGGYHHGVPGGVNLVRTSSGSPPHALYSNNPNNNNNQQRISSPQHQAFPPHQPLNMRQPQNDNPYSPSLVLRNYFENFHVGSANSPRNIAGAPQTPTTTILNFEYIIKFSGTLLSAKKFKETFQDLCSTEGLFQIPFVRNFATFGHHPIDNTAPVFPTYYPSFDFITSLIMDYLTKQKEQSSNQSSPGIGSNKYDDFSVLLNSLSASNDGGDNGQLFFENESCSPPVVHNYCNYIIEISMKYSVLHQKVFDWKMDLLATDSHPVTI
jgi:type II secretory pathway pseudopilin PulG